MLEVKMLTLNITVENHSLAASVAMQLAKLKSDCWHPKLKFHFRTQLLLLLIQLPSLVPVEVQETAKLLESLPLS